MRNIFLIFAFLLLQLFSFNAHSAQDPISWSLSPSTGFPASTTVGNSYSVTYTLRNNLPFPVTIATPKSYSGNTLFVNDNCNNKTLAANGTCTISLGIQPAHAGVHTAYVTIQYGHTQVRLPALTTTTTSGNSNSTTGVIGYVTQPLPSQAQLVGTAYPVIFTFLNNSSSSVTATSVSVSGFTASTNTCTSALAANATCRVTGTFTPSATGEKTLSVTYNYTQGSAQSVALSTTTNIYNQGGACTEVSGLATLPLPNSTYIYSDNVIKFTFTNNCTSVANTLGSVDLAATLNGQSVNSYLTRGSVSGLNDTCSGQTLAANGGSCSVYVSVIPTATGSSLSVEASAAVSGSSTITSAATSETVSAIPNQTSNHTVTFVNQCNYPVWYEFLNGSGVHSPDPNAGGTPSSYQLAASIGGEPVTTSLAVSQYINGKINARTGCDPTTMICATASCTVNPGTGTCITDQGAGLPSTAFEATMTSTAATDGVYDVSLINGVNVPVEVKGLGPTTSDPTVCTGAGAPIQPVNSSVSTQLGACSWQFTPPNSGIDTTAAYTFVSAGADSACTSDSDCTAPAICGQAYNSATSPGNGVPINRTCGTFQGYWTIADYIGYSSSSQWGSVNLYNTYGIGNTLASAYGNSTVNPGQATNYDLYGCKPTSTNALNTGYNGGNSYVCGCTDWDLQSDGSKTYVSQACCTPTTCGNASITPAIVEAPNSLWTSTVFSRIAWLKRACPTAYSYQFDDKSSSYTCNQTGQFTGYQIVLCPAGKTGNPAG